MQLVGQQLPDGWWAFLKHFFEDKIPSRLLQTSLPGELKIINYGTNFRSGIKGFQYMLEHVGQWGVLWFQTQVKEPKKKTKEASEGFRFHPFKRTSLEHAQQADRVD